MTRIPALDNHFHCDPENGRGLEAIKEFRKAGGTHLIIVVKPSWYYGIDPGEGEGYERIYEKNYDICREARSLGVEAYSVVGVHPAELDYLVRKKGLPLEKATRIVERGLEIAAKFVEEGKALAIGEIGLPHYEVPDEINRECWRLLRKGLELARDADCAVQLHTGKLDIEGLARIVSLAENVGFDPRKLVKHFSPPMIREMERLGPIPSVLASQKNLEEAIKFGDRFLLETDYLDDNRRPGAVLGPKTVPRRVRELVERGMEETVYKVCQEIPSKVYDIEISL